MNLSNYVKDLFNNKTKTRVDNENNMTDGQGRLLLPKVGGGYQVTRLLLLSVCQNHKPASTSPGPV